MINLLSTTDAQTIAFIPRIECDEFTPTSLVIRRESSGVETTFTPTFFRDRFYLTTSLVLALNENELYTLTIKDVNGTELYIDTVFCTNQNLDTYTINKDIYIYG